MGVYSEAIQRLYVAYFGRPADWGGLNYWEKVVAASNGDTSAVSAAFAASPEYTHTYANMVDARIVTQVYQNLFGHAPDAAGLKFWTDALVNRQMSTDDMVTMIAGSARGSDAVAFGSKVSAAAAFTLVLDTPSRVLAYSGVGAVDIARTFIASVTDDASLKAAIAPEALERVISSMWGDWHVLPFTLTGHADNLTGSMYGDRFDAFSFNAATGAPENTMSAEDVLDGGAGKDVLYVDIRNGYNTVFGTIRNIEEINLTESAGTAIDASIFKGANIVKQIGNAGTISNLPADVIAAFDTVTGPMAVEAAGASAYVSLDRVHGTLAVAGKQLDSLILLRSQPSPLDGPVAAWDVRVTAGIDVQNFTIRTDQPTHLALAEDSATSSHIANVSATASRGAIDLDANKLPGLASVATGTGNDSISVRKFEGHALTVQAGDGNDTVVITGRLEAGDVIDGGAGKNTLVLTGAGASASDPVLNTVVKNFSSIRFVDTTAQGGLDASRLGPSYTTISLDAGGTVVGVAGQAIIAQGNLSATASGYGADGAYAGNLKVTETANGTVTARAKGLDLAVKAGAASIAATLAGDVQSASVNLVNGHDDAHPNADVIARVSITAGVSNLAKLASLVLQGNGSATVNNADGASLAAVDASALGGMLADGGAAQGLDYSSTNGKAESIQLGAGIDHVTIGASTYGQMDVISGLNLVLNGAGTALAAGSDHLAVTGLPNTVQVFAPSQPTLDLALLDAARSAKGNDLVFTLGGDTYIYHDGGIADTVDAGDTLVKLTGAIDLKALVIALGGTPG